MPVTPEVKKTMNQSTSKKHKNKTYFKNGEGGRKQFLKSCPMSYD